MRPSQGWDIHRRARSDPICRSRVYFRRCRKQPPDGGTARDLGGTSIDLQVLHAIAGPFELQGAGFVFGFAVFEPQFWTFDEMAVGVDRPGIFQLVKSLFLVVHEMAPQ